MSQLNVASSVTTFETLFPEKKPEAPAPPTASSGTPVVATGNAPPPPPLGLPPPPIPPAKITTLIPKKSKIDSKPPIVTSQAFYEKILPYIIEQTLLLPLYFPTGTIQLLVQQQEATVSFEKKHVTSLLAASFLSLFADLGNRREDAPGQDFPVFDISQLFHARLASSSMAQYTISLLLYFQTCAEKGSSCKVYPDFTFW